MWLVENGLSGPIPPELGKLANLRDLGLRANALSGSIPAELGDLANLESLWLGYNHLTGSLPAWLGNLARLRSLELALNELSGPIPAELGNLGNLVFLDLQWNRLTGPVPGELGRLVNLQLLRLNLNGLSGPIPAEFGNLVNLKQLSLNGNQLTGPIPDEASSLVNLERVWLRRNELTGPLPSWLGRLSNLQDLRLEWNAFAGPIPPELGGLSNLEELGLGWNWGVSGPLPAGLRLAPLEEVDIFATQVCAPAEWRHWLASIGFSGTLCGREADAMIDVAVVYTPAAREAAGGAAAIEAEIDLMIAETNEAYAASDVRHRLALASRSEVAYAETGNSFLDLHRLVDPADGHLDEAHALRDRVGADLVHLLFKEGSVSGIARLGSAFGLTCQSCGGLTFAHELGHNMGLRHDRYQVHHEQGGAGSHPAFGYVNQRAFDTGAARSRRWRTIMSYATQCADARVECASLPRFSNPRQTWEGDPLGVPFEAGGSGVDGPADAAAVLAATGPAVALWRDPPGMNRPPVAVGRLPDRELSQHGSLDLDVSPAFVDPDGDPLSHAVSSSAPDVATVLAAGARITLTGVGLGAATVRVTATDPGGLKATQAFTVTVTPPPNRPPETVGALPPLTIELDDDAVALEVAGAFRDPDGDALTYGATSSAPAVAAAAVSGSTLTVTPVGTGNATVSVTANDRDGSNSAAIQAFTVTVTPPPNRPPETVGALPPLTIELDDDAVALEVAGAFRDPDGDALTYGATSSAPAVAAAAVSGSTLTVTPVGTGNATVSVTANDRDGSNSAAIQAFTVTVVAPFTDHPIVPGETPVRVIHFSELRSRIDALRTRAGLAPYGWTDPALTERVTPVRRVHLLELRSAVAEAYAAAGRQAPSWTDAAPAAGATPIRAVHLMELRASVAALE